jgi:hypothetical protein
MTVEDGLPLMDVGVAAAQTGIGYVSLYLYFDVDHTRTVYKARVHTNGPRSYHYIWVRLRSNILYSLQ